MVEDVVDLRHQLQPASETVPNAGVDDRVGRRAARTEIVRPVRLMVAVLISARDRVGGGHEIEIDRQLRGRLDVGVRLERVPWDERNAIAGSDGDGSLESLSA